MDSVCALQELRSMRTDLMIDTLIVKLATMESLSSLGAPRDVRDGVHQSFCY